MSDGANRNNYEKTINNLRAHCPLNFTKMDIYEEYIENVIQLAEEAIDDCNYKQAKDLLLSGLAEEPGYPKLHATMGRLYHYEIENQTMAEMHYHLALHFKPAYQEVYDDLAWLYIQHKKYVGLKHWMKKAKKVKGVCKGMVYENLGKVAEAEKDYKKALKLFKKGLLKTLNDLDASRLKKHIKRNKYKNTELRKKSDSLKS